MDVVVGSMSCGWERVAHGVSGDGFDGRRNGCNVLGVVGFGENMALGLDDFGKNMALDMEVMGVSAGWVGDGEQGIGSIGGWFPGELGGKFVVGKKLSSVSEVPAE